MAPILASGPAGAASVEAAFQFPAANGDGSAAKGALPLAGLTLATDGSGALFGTASRGGNYSTNGYGGGLTYELLPSGSGGGFNETVLHAFTGKQDGIFPGTANVLLLNGNVYGTTAGQAEFGGCGKYDCDTVYELAPPESGKTAWSYTLLYRFAGGADGYEPQGGVIAGPGGVLYGTTAAGGNTQCQSSYTNLYGTSGCGTVFQLTPSSSGTAWKKTILHVFSGGSDGGLPLASLIADPSGNGVLYGTASTGGSSNCSFYTGDCGVVFSLTPPAAGKTAWTETVLYSFLGGTDGFAPVGALTIEKGVLYGTAMSGGSSCNIYGCGTVFQLTPPAKGQTTWRFQALYAFKGGTDGGVPMGSVTSGKGGVLYGTTFQYGDTKIDCGRFAGCGTVFKLTPPKAGASAWKETVLYTFTGGATGGQSSSGLTADANVLFGIAMLGGSSQCPPSSDPSCGGVVFSYSP